MLGFGVFHFHAEGLIIFFLCRGSSRKHDWGTDGVVELPAPHYALKLRQKAWLESQECRVLRHAHFTNAPAPFESIKIHSSALKRFRVLWLTVLRWH